MSSKEQGFKDGSWKVFKQGRQSFAISKEVHIGVRNLHRWILIKESLGFVNDSQFASFLLTLAEQEQTSENKPSQDSDNVDKVEPNPMEQTKTSGVYEGGESEYEEEDSCCDDDEDDDWKPSGCRQSRVMKRPSRGRKKYESQRQTRSQSKAALTEKDSENKPYNPRRVSGAQDEEDEEEEEETNDEDEGDEIVPIPALKVSLKGCHSGKATTTRLPQIPHGIRHESNKTAVFRSRVCVDCGLKHSPGECPLRAPTLLVPDSPCDVQSSLVLAEATLPSGLKLEVVDKVHGQSVFTTEKIHRYTQFGPLIGKVIAEAEISEDANLKNIWEVFGETKTYLDTSDPATSNWLRYIRPAMSREERNVAAMTRSDGRLCFVTTHDIQAGAELLYWSEDPSVTWSKKKLEKTSCGGCNQRFEHPLYYRMHCMIFHDPNFSLTIRKYHCKVCGVAVLGKENIMKHAMEMHDGKGAYQCQYCKKFFLRLHSLDTHVSYSCKLNPWKMHPLCETCGKKFCQPQHLRAHIKRMHSDMSEVLKEFQCKTCFKLLGSRAALQRHLKEVHNKDQNIAATCDRCGKTFQNKSNLKIHMLTHSGVKPFRCCESGCTAAFTTKQCLQFHYKKVHGYGMHNMPSIERCVAYTFESYSGGLVSVFEKNEAKVKGKKDRGTNLLGSETSRDTMGLGGGSEDSSEMSKSFQITPEKLVEVALKTMDPSVSPIPDAVNCIKQEGTPLHSSVLDSTSENSTIDSHIQDVATPTTSNADIQGTSMEVVESPSGNHHHHQHHQQQQHQQQAHHQHQQTHHQDLLMDEELNACKEMEMASLKSSAMENLGRHVAIQRQAGLLALGLSRSMLEYKPTNRPRLDPLQQFEHDLDLGRHDLVSANQYPSLAALCLARQRAEMIGVSLTDTEMKLGRHIENGNMNEQQHEHDMNLSHMNDGRGGGNGSAGGGGGGSGNGGGPLSHHVKHLSPDTGMQQCDDEHESRMEMNSRCSLEQNMEMHVEGMIQQQNNSGGNLDLSHHSHVHTHPHHHGLEMSANPNQLDHQMEMRRQLEQEISLSHEVNELDMVHSTRNIHLDLSQRNDRQMNHVVRNNNNRSDINMSSRVLSLEMDDHRMEMSPPASQLASPLHREHLMTESEVVHPLTRHHHADLRSPLSLAEHHGYNLSQHRANLPSPLTRHQEQSLDMSCHTSNMNSPTPSRCSELNSPLPNQDAALELSRCDTPVELSRPPSHSIDLTTGRPTSIDINRPPSHGGRQMTPGVELTRPSDLLSLEASRMVCSSGYQGYSPPMYQNAPPAHMPPPSPTVHSTYHSYPGYY